jgi:hypothetical protein
MVGAGVTGLVSAGGAGGAAGVRLSQPAVANAMKTSAAAQQDRLCLCMVAPSGF